MEFKYRFMRAFRIEATFKDMKVVSIRRTEDEPVPYHMACWPKVLNSLSKNPYSPNINFEEVEQDRQVRLDPICGYCEQAIYPIGEK